MTNKTEHAAEQPRKRVMVTIEDGIADVQLNRPFKLNAIDRSMFVEIDQVLTLLESTRDLRAVVLSGAGRAFCGGVDVASMRNIDYEELVAIRSCSSGVNLAQRAAWGWRQLPVPVVAAAQHSAFGGGLQIFCGADVRIAHPNTRFSIMEIKLGLVPDMGGFVFWSSMLQDGLFRELVFTGRQFSAKEAEKLGIVSHLDDDPHGRASTIAKEIARQSPDAVRAAKRLANAEVKEAVSVLELESREQLVLMRTKNHQQAVEAILLPRDPIFSYPQKQG